MRFKNKNFLKRWIYKGNYFTVKDVKEDYYGFVYQITNLLNNKKYIGKKKFYRNYTRDSGKKGKYQNWSYYMSSCAELNEDIKKYGVENFLFEILHIAKNKLELTYYEAMEQFKTDCIRRNDYYNSNILGKFYRDKLCNQDEI